MIACTFEDGNSASLRHVVVDILVIKDGQLLLVKRTGKLLEGGKWGLVGGFAERDETMAQAAAREVHEETGWEITGLTLLTIRDNPDRRHEDRQNVSFIYFAHAAKQTGRPDWESDDIKWFPLDNLPPLDSLAFDHAKNIELYQRYRREQFSLPVLN